MHRRKMPTKGPRIFEPRRTPEDGTIAESARTFPRRVVQPMNPNALPAHPLMHDELPLYHCSVLLQLEHMFKGRDRTLGPKG